MLIDRSNYEMWIIDWLDGNLSNQQAEELLAFLYCNPDIQVEFEDIASVSLKPLETNFRKKDLLWKSSHEVPLSQFEYLSIACLENDLTVDQLSDLKEIIELDSEKSRIHDLIQKTKVKPVYLRYLHKSRLTKRPVKQRIIQLSVIGLSLAATLALIITSYLIVPRSQINIGSDGLRSLTATTPNTKMDESRSVPASKPNPKMGVSRSVPATTTNIGMATSRSVPAIPDDRTAGLLFIPPEKITFHPNLDMNIKILPNTLIASTARLIIPSPDYERSNIGRFIARNFRQKLLKENNLKDTPLKAYEIAEAGVKGLNKLFGWQMALNEVTNEDGEASSVYFNSKLLKFNAPVKNPELFP
jgi:hypothetical protein